MAYSLRRRVELLFTTFPEAILSTKQIAAILAARDDNHAHGILSSLMRAGVVKRTMFHEDPAQSRWCASLPDASVAAAADAEERWRNSHHDLA